MRTLLLFYCKTLQQIHGNGVAMYFLVHIFYCSMQPWKERKSTKTQNCSYWWVHDVALVALLWTIYIYIIAIDTAIRMEFGIKQVKIGINMICSQFMPSHNEARQRVSCVHGSWGIVVVIFMWFEWNWTWRADPTLAFWHHCPRDSKIHYSAVIMGAMASQITGVWSVYSTVCSGADQRKHQSSASLALWGESTGDRWIPHKAPVTRKMFPFDDVIMSIGVLLIINYKA